MTRDELIYNIRVKMDADPTSNDDDYYMNSYNTLIDECLSIIANTVLPYQETMIFQWGGYWSESTVPQKEESKEYYYTIDFTGTISGKDSEGKIYSQDCKRKDWLEYKNGKWTVQSRNTYGYLATIPNGFLSFSDEASVQFWNSYNELELGADILYVNSKTLALSKDGKYEISYNSEYPSIATLDSNLEDTIPTNVLKLIPVYVAAQLMMSEDPIRGTQLKNDFETMLARLDTNKPLVSYRINNSDGWVL